MDFPPRSAFFNQIKQKELSQEDYEGYKALYENRLQLPDDDPNKWRNMSDYLKHYNCLDVEPLVEALSTCFDKFRQYFQVDPGELLTNFFKYTTFLWASDKKKTKIY